MPRPICVKCKQELKPAQNGVAAVSNHHGKDIELWDADLWKCPVCGHELIFGFGNNPVTGEWEKGRFASIKKKYAKDAQLIRFTR